MEHDMTKQEKRFDEQLIMAKHRYRIDYAEKVFQHYKLPQQVIPFSAFKDNGKGGRQAYINGISGSLITEVQDLVYGVRITLPEALFKGPFIGSKELVSTLNEEGAKGNFRLLDDNQRERMDKGKLPSLTMGPGDIWIYDGRLNEIRNSQPPYNVIKLEFMEKSADLKHHVLVYDTAKKKEGELDWRDAIGLPESYVMLKFPIRKVFDPVGLARSLQAEDHAFLVKTPGLAQYEAKVIPWSRTAIYQIIARNRTKLDLPQLPRKAQKLRR